MNELVIKRTFEVSADTQEAIKRLNNKQSIKHANALAGDINDFTSAVETAGKMVADMAAPISKSIAIQLSIIDENETFGKKAAFKGIADFAEQAFNMKPSFTSNHVGVGRLFYRSNNPTAVTACEWYMTVSVLSKFLPLRKLSKEAFPYSLIQEAFDNSELTSESTQSDIEEWVKSKLPVVEKDEPLFDCVRMPSGERMNGVKFSKYLEQFGEGSKVRKLALDEGETLVDEDGTTWEVLSIVKSDYSSAQVVWRHRHKEPKGVTKPAVSRESPLDRVKRLLAELSPEELDELHLT